MLAVVVEYKEGVVITYHVTLRLSVKWAAVINRGQNYQRASLARGMRDTATVLDNDDNISYS